MSPSDFLFALLVFIFVGPIAIGISIRILRPVARVFLYPMEVETIDDE